MPSELKRFLLIYSSQTGQAKAIAEEVAEKASDHGIQADVHCISQTEKRFWLERENLAVIITSTTGDGDPPDTANKFWRRLKKKTLERNHLSHLRFSLLGLGDSNYSNFCNCAKNFDRRFKELGAVPFFDSRFADDAVGLELEVEPWMEALFPALRRELYGGSDDCVVNGDSESGQLKDPVATNNKTTTDNPLNKDEVDSSTDKKPASDIPKIDGNRIMNDSSVTDKSATNGIISDKVRTDSLENSNCDNTENQANGSVVYQTHGPVGNSPTQISNTKLNADSLSDANLLRHSQTQTLQTESSRGVQNGGGDSLIRSNESAKVLPESEGGDAQTKEETLTHSVPPLCESPLTLPVLPAQYLKLAYTPEYNIEEDRPELQNGCPFPSAKSDVAVASIIQAKQLTRHDAVKKTLKLTLDIKDVSWEWSPGDSFGVLCPNPALEVECLLNRLKVEADTPYSLEVIAGTKKKSAAVPPHIPPRGTLRQVFTHCCDIRSPPKKALLRCLVDCAKEEGEKRRLQELCSKQGADSYTRLVRQTAVSPLDVLAAFPSCTPPIGCLLEHLPRLQPRPYSAASSPVVNKNQLDLVFNIVDIPAGRGRCEARLGVATGHLDTITRELQANSGKNIGNETHRDSDTQYENLSQKVEQLQIKEFPKVPIYLRSNQHFRPPVSVKQPLIMIGPGTGVAPFIGFLQERDHLIADTQEIADIGECWLFFGCRHKDRDYIFRKELEQFVEHGTLSRLLVCFSRDGGDNQPRYVQDMMRHHADQVISLIIDSNAVVYVCGDAQGMARDVSETFVQLLQLCRGFSEKDAADYIKQMRLSQRYKEDVWT